MSRPLISCLAGAILFSAASTSPALGQTATSLHNDIDRLAAEVNAQVIDWRRDIHANPELGNQEFRTAALVAEHLESLGLEVEAGVGGTGVVGVLRGGRGGPTVALRADMDALPVTEQVDLPFASKATAMWQGREVGVMHACGHDNHVAILMGAATVLSEMKDDLPGTVKFLFQPAEELPPGGALPMLADGAFENPKPDAVFGLHVAPLPVGTVAYRSGGVMASGDELRIVVRGTQTHGAMPWAGVDPIVTAAQILVGLQTVVSRQVDLTASPAVVTIGQIEGGNRGNIIPDTVLMVGTIRALSPETRTKLHEGVKQVAENIAAAAGATADVDITLGYPVTVNDPDLTTQMVPTLRRVVGEGAQVRAPTTGGEDFSYFAQQVPGLFVTLGVAPLDDPSKVHPNHSPLFYADESALEIGVRTMTSLAVDYLAAGQVASR